MGDIYDVIVIGGGVVGVGTGLALVKKGLKTLILEQFGLYHSRGSSSGESRVIRTVHHKEVYVAMMIESYKLWKEIEIEFGEKIMHFCGGLIIPLNRKSELIAVREASLQLIKANVTHEIINGTEIKKRWPYLKVPNDTLTIWEPQMGILYARKAIDAMLSIFLKRGGNVLDHRKVIKIEQVSNVGGNILKITTYNGDSFLCKNITVCAGPWTNHVLSLVNLKLPISPQKVVVPFWKIEEDQLGKLVQMPVLIFWKETDVKFFYALQEYDYPGMLKIATHVSTPCDPDERDASENDPQIIPKISEFISDYFTPGMIATTPSVHDNCIYTLTPDYDFIMDQHPTLKNIYFCTGFSGQGFKLAPVIGQLMADLVSGDETKFGMKDFRMCRFTKAKL